jgi:hypothetical protein
MNVSRKTSFAAGAVMALVLGSGTAYAATGGDFRLGAVNRATHMSTLQNTHGSALMMKSGEHKPAFQVNREVMIPHLNANLLGGRQESSFALTTGGVGVITATGFGVDNDSNGFPEEVSAVATCPVGTVRTGGGALDQTNNGVTWMNGPTGAGSWQVNVTTDNATAQAEDVQAMVMCYNPRGAVETRTVSTTKSQVFAHVTPATRDKLLGR